MYMNGHSDLDFHTFRYFTEFIIKFGYNPKNFYGASNEDEPVVEKSVQRNHFSYVFDVQEGDYVVELARRLIWSFDKTVKTLRFNNYVIHTNDINSFFDALAVMAFSTGWSISIDRYLMICKDRVQHTYLKKVYTLRKTLFEKLEGFKIIGSKDNFLFNNLAIFDLDSIRIPTDELKATQTSSCIGKYVIISVSKSSNLVIEPIFLYTKDPQGFINDFVNNLDILAEEKINLEMRTKLNGRCRNHLTEIFEQWEEKIDDTEELICQPSFQEC